METGFDNNNINNRLKRDYGWAQVAFDYLQRCPTAKAPTKMIRNRLNAKNKRLSVVHSFGLVSGAGRSL